MSSSAIGRWGRGTSMNQLIHADPITFQEQSWVIRLFDIAFNVCFTIELGLRLSATQSFAFNSSLRSTKVMTLCGGQCWMVDINRVFIMTLQHAQLIFVAQEFLFSGLRISVLRQTRSSSFLATILLCTLAMTSFWKCKAKLLLTWNCTPLQPSPATRYWNILDIVLVLYRPWSICISSVWNATTGPWPHEQLKRYSGPHLLRKS